jgi:hypothetical protein
LGKIAANKSESLGDMSTLADPAVVTKLIDNREWKRQRRRCLRGLSAAAINC